MFENIYLLLSFNSGKVAHVLKLAPWRCVGDKANFKGVEICVAAGAPLQFWCGGGFVE